MPPEFVSSDGMGTAMNDTSSRVSTDIDFEQDGKHQGTFRVPNSRNDSAWGTLVVPLTCIRNGDGPTVLFTAGNHGDEYEGQAALLNLARGLEAAEVQGRVFILPHLNLPAVQGAQRVSPIDGKNMNRIFPGKWDGSISEAIADFVYRQLVERADIVVDIHSGGKSMYFTPSAVIHKLPDPDHQAKCLAALQAFRAPLGLILEELDAEGMLDSAVEDLGKVFVSTEIGGAGALSAESVSVAARGVRNILVHAGVLEGELEGPETRIMDVPDADCFATAPVDGLFEPFADLGADVTAGQQVGQVHSIRAPHQTPVPVMAARGGIVIGKRALGECATGDMLIMVGIDA